jgi:hypothetical protein
MQLKLPNGDIQKFNHVITKQGYERQGQSQTAAIGRVNWYRPRGSQLANSYQHSKCVYTLN